MTPPRRPSRLTWPVFARLLGRVLAGLALVWVVALVAWPENHRPFGPFKWSFAYPQPMPPTAFPIRASRLIS